MNEEYVTISMKEYLSLIDAKDHLDALHAGGVTNWDWYYESLKDAGLVDEED